MKNVLKLTKDLKTEKTRESENKNFSHPSLHINILHNVRKKYRRKLFKQYILFSSRVRKTAGKQKTKKKKDKKSNENVLSNSRNRSKRREEKKMSQYFLFKSLPHCNLVSVQRQLGSGPGAGK